MKTTTLKKAGEVQEGDRVLFQMTTASYTVDEVEETAIGMVRHRHGLSSSCYWPNEILVVEGER